MYTMPTATSRITDPNMMPPHRSFKTRAFPGRGQHRDRLGMCQSSSCASRDLRAAHAKTQWGERKLRPPHLNEKPWLFQLRQSQRSGLIRLRLRLWLRQRKLLGVDGSHRRTVVASQSSHAPKLLLLHFKRTLHHHRDGRTRREDDGISVLHHRDKKSCRGSSARTDTGSHSRIAGRVSGKASHTRSGNRGSGYGLSVTCLIARLLDQSFLVL